HCSRSATRTRRSRVRALRARLRHRGSERSRRSRPRRRSTRSSAPMRRDNRRVPTPIVLDCDPGHDAASALLLALASPELELLGVTTTYGNQTVEKTTANALRVLELVGRTDVPVARGAASPRSRPLTVAAHVHGDSGLDGPALPPPSVAPAGTPAVEWLAATI